VAAAGLLEEAADWFSRRLDDGSSADFRRQGARTLYAADRLEEAETIFRELAREADGNVAPVGFHHGHLQAHLDEGYLAVIAARLGREQEAERPTRRLEDLDPPFGFGAPWFWLAALAAVRGEERNAASHLRRALAEGLPHEMFLHTDPHLARLRGDPVFGALMRPRG
jgi:tetratricopeptide (TPR) repeat protein